MVGITWLSAVRCIQHKSHRSGLYIYINQLTHLGSLTVWMIKIIPTNQLIGETL